MTDAELEADRQKCVDDIHVCLDLEAHGIKTYNNEQSVLHRLKCNQAIIALIDEELAHRKEKQE